MAAVVAQASLRPGSDDPDSTGALVKPAAVARAIGIPVNQWPGRCHEIADACLKAKIVRGRLCYGHFIGGIAKTGYFAGRPLAHHGWIELPDGRIWDPTRWVFEDVAPYIYIGPLDRYDFGGNALNDAFRAPYPDIDPTERPSLTLAIPPSVARALQTIIGRPDWTPLLTPRQVHWLANINIHRLRPRECRSLFRAIIEIGYQAHIPYDNRQRILGD